MATFEERAVVEAVNTVFQDVGKEFNKEVEPHYLAGLIASWLPPPASEQIAAILGSGLAAIAKTVAANNPDYEDAFTDGVWEPRRYNWGPGNFKGFWYDGRRTLYRARETFPEEGENDGTEFVVQMRTEYTSWMETSRCRMPVLPTTEFFNRAGQQDIQSMTQCLACETHLLPRQQPFITLSGNKRMRMEYCNPCSIKAWSTPCAECGAVQGARQFKRRRRDKIDRTRCTRCAKNM